MGGHHGLTACDGSGGTTAARGPDVRGDRTPIDHRSERCPPVRDDPRWRYGVATGIVVGSFVTLSTTEAYPVTASPARISTAA